MCKPRRRRRRRRSTSATLADEKGLERVETGGGARASRTPGARGTRGVARGDPKDRPRDVERVAPRRRLCRLGAARSRDEGQALPRLAGGSRSSGRTRRSRRAPRRRARAPRTARSAARGTSPGSPRRHPNRRSFKRGRSRGLNLAEAPVPELAMLRLRSMPQYARVMQAASEASAAPAASPSSYVTPPRTQSKIPLPRPEGGCASAPAPHATPAPPPARAERKDDWLDLDVTPPRVDLLGLTRGVTRSPLGAMAVNIEAATRRTSTR